MILLGIFMGVCWYFIWLTFAIMGILALIDIIKRDGKKNIKKR